MGNPVGLGRVIMAETGQTRLEAEARGEEAGMGIVGHRRDLPLAGEYRRPSRQAAAQPNPLWHPPKLRTRCSCKLPGTQAESLHEGCPIFNGRLTRRLPPTRLKTSIGEKMRAGEVHDVERHRPPYLQNRDCLGLLG